MENLPRSADLSALLGDAHRRLVETGIRAAEAHAVGTTRLLGFSRARANPRGVIDAACAGTSATYEVQH
jgi:hypothetical protein